MTTHHTNPLIPNHADQPGHGTRPAADSEPVLKPPAHPAAAYEDKNPAVDMIRQKLAAIYGDEPDTKQEIAEVKAATTALSKHQQYMYNLSNSGKPLAEIQTAWHQYYAGLPDDQKREVWQEFYNNSAKSRQQQANAIATPTPQPAHNPSPVRERTAVGQTNNPLFLPKDQPERIPASRAPQPFETVPNPGPNHSREMPTVAATPTPATASPQEQLTAYMAADGRPVDTIREQLRNKVGSRSKLKVKHHLQSLLFGIGFGGLVLVIVLFSFFNEVVIAPFVQPSRKVSATPIIVGTDGIAATDKSEVIIPKINLEIPLDFSAQTINENDIENGLENGVVHYPTTALPGQKGNASFFGHSSNNIFSPGKYKFAFVLLHELVPGDTFILTYKGVAYTYQVYDKKVVEPSDVSVLNPVAGKDSTAVLITCDPPGTSLHRLVVWGEQVSPNPSSNTVAAPTPTTSGAEQSLPGNGPTLWRRLVNAITGD